MHTQRIPNAVALVLLLIAWATGACRQQVTTGTVTPAATTPPQETPTLQASLPAASPTVETSPTASASETPVSAATATPTEIQAGVPVSLTQVVMHTASDGWALSFNGHVYHTARGAAQWQDVTPGQAVQEGVRVSAAAFPPGAPREAIAAAYKFEEGGKAQILVFRTQDAGETWEASEPVDVTFMDMLGLVQLFSQDGQHAWLLGEIYPGMFHVYTALWASQDGGAHWSLVNSPEPDASSPSLLAGSYSLPYGSEILAFPNDLVGFAGTGDLQVTRDGGKTWQVVSLPKGPNYPKLKQASEFAAPPRFTSPQDGAFLLRVDEADSPYCPPCDQFQGLPQALYVYVTHDGGGTWRPSPAPAKIGSLAFLDAQTGFFLGKDDPAPAAPVRFFGTQDGGQSWTAMETSQAPPLGSALQFVDAQHGYAYNLNVTRGQNPFQAYDPRATGSAYLYQTSDGGLTWTQLGQGAAGGPTPGETPASEPASASQVPPLAAGQAITLTAISMQDRLTGWGVEAGGHLVRTGDGGQTWRDISPSRDFYVPSGFFALDAHTAWATFRSWCGAWAGDCQGPDHYLQNTTVWRTQDGGQSWQASQPVKLGIPSSRAQLASLPHLAFSDARHGWLLAWLYASHMGQIYQELFHTTDGGQTWEVAADETQLPMMGGVLALAFPDPQSGWAIETWSYDFHSLLLYRSGDGGKSWQKVSLPGVEGTPEPGGPVDCFDGAATASLPVIAFQANCIRLAGGSPQALALFSRDGGESWEYWAGVSSLIFITPATGWRLRALSADSSAIEKTGDGGQTWSPVKTVRWQGALDFVDEQAGWAIARSGQAVALVQSLDGGKTWRELKPVVRP